MATPDPRQVRTTLRTLFATTFGLPSPEEAEEAAYRQVPGWDSVGHMELVQALEDTFGLLLDTEDIIAMDSFVHTCEILGRYGVDALP